MTICFDCQAPVKYIATTRGDVVKVEQDKIVFYTENGRKVEGYKLHECNDNNQGNRP